MWVFLNVQAVNEMYVYNESHQNYCTKKFIDRFCSDISLYIYITKKFIVKDYPFILTFSSLTLLKM